MKQARSKLFIAFIPTILGVAFMIVGRLTQGTDPTSWIKFFDLSDIGLALASIGVLTFAVFLFDGKGKTRS